MPMNVVLGLFGLRKDCPLPVRMVAGGICVGILVLVWFIVTAGRPEDRIVSIALLGSPSETLDSFKELWFDKALARNMVVSLVRLIEGFGLAALIGVPLGVTCGTWPVVNALLAPVSVFGRNVPMTAMVPLTMLWFGTDESQKVMFIFIACVMFIVFDSGRAVAGVAEQYVQTGLTLGATKAQVVFKILVPLALPAIFGSLRLLFGLAFGYIIVAEMVNQKDGIGALILNAQRLGPKEHVYLALIAITLVAYGVDRLLYFTERALFPYREP